jgi:hypothetical protein
MFALRDPDRLQSEEFLVRSMELRFMSKRHGPIGEIAANQLPLHDNVETGDDGR